MRQQIWAGLGLLLLAGCEKQLWGRFSEEGSPDGAAQSDMAAGATTLKVDGANLRTRRFGSDKNDRGGAVALSSQGDVFLGAYYSGILSFDGQRDLMPIPGMNADAPLLARLGGDMGTLQVPPLTAGGGAGAYLAENSQLMFDGRDNPRPYVSLAVDKKGDLIIAGTYHGSLSNFQCKDAKDGSGSSDGYSTFVAKLEGGSLSCQWLRLISGARGTDILTRSVAVNSAGTIFVAGQFSSKLTFNNKTYDAGSASWRAFIVPYSTAGDAGTLRDFGASTATFGTALAVDGNDNVYLAGQFSGTGLEVKGAPLQNAGKLDAFVIKLDANLNDVWGRSYGSTGNEFVGSLAVSRSGAVALTGTSDHAISWDRDHTTSVKGATDAFLALLKDGGDLLWVRGIGASDSGAGRVVAFDENEDVLLAGMWRGSIDEERVTSGSQDLFLARYAGDGSGQRHLFLPFGGLGNEDVFGLSYQPGGAVVLAGYSDSGALAIDGVPSSALSPRGGEDILLIRLLPAL